MAFLCWNFLMVVYASTAPTWLKMRYRLQTLLMVGFYFFWLHSVLFLDRLWSFPTAILFMKIGTYLLISLCSMLLLIALCKWKHPLKRKFGCQLLGRPIQHLLVFLFDVFGLHDWISYVQQYCCTFGHWLWIISFLMVHHLVSGYDNFMVTEGLFAFTCCPV